MNPEYLDDDELAIGLLSAVPQQPSIEPKGWFKRWANKFSRFWQREIGTLPQDLARRAAIAKVESIETENMARYHEAVSNVQVALSVSVKNKAEAFAIVNNAQLQTLERLLAMHEKAPDELKESLKEKIEELSLYSGSVFIGTKSQAVPELAEEP